MLISKELRKKNIAEYLLYMWQVEDLLRAVDLDADKLASIVDSSGQPEEVCREWKQWYADLADMMRSEGIRKNGHLQINSNVIIMLADLNKRLLASDKMQDYKHEYYKALPVIVEFRAKNGMSTGSRSEIEDCFDLMYGVLMLRLKGAEISKGTEDAAGTVSHLLAMLSDMYKKDRDGFLDLDNENDI